MALLPIRYQRAAVDELDDAVRWYARQSAEIANQFRQLVRAKIAEARSAPHHWTQDADGTRLILLGRFPYLLIVREFKGFLEIVACAHASRESGYWRDRLS